MKRFREVCIAVIIAFLLFSSLVYAEISWTTDKRLTNNSGHSFSPAIAVDGANIYVVWDDNTPGNYEIYFKRSVDGGNTWSAQKRLTKNAGNSHDAAIAVDGKNIYVVWWNYTPDNYYKVYFKHSIDGGFTWAANNQLTKGAGYSYNPDIAVDGSNVYVVWQRHPEIYFKRSVDKGVTWKTNKRLSNDTGSSYVPVIAVDDSNIYVVWSDDTPGNPEIYFKRSVDRGVTWKTNKRLSNNTGSSFYPAIAVNDFNIYVVWEDGEYGNHEIYFKRSVDGGATWTVAKRLTSNTGDLMSPAIAANSSNIYVAWVDHTQPPSDIFFKRSVDGGDTWTTTKRLTNNSGWSYGPVLAVDGANVYVVWYDDTPGNYEIYFKKGVLD